MKGVLCLKVQGKCASGMLKDAASPSLSFMKATAKEKKKQILGQKEGRGETKLVSHAKKSPRPAPIFLPLQATSAFNGG